MACIWFGIQYVEALCTSERFYVVPSVPVAAAVMAMTSDTEQPVPGTAQEPNKQRENTLTGLFLVYHPAAPNHVAARR
jgi:hypothetical protein